MPNIIIFNQFNNTVFLGRHYGAQAVRRKNYYIVEAVNDHDITLLM